MSASLTSTTPMPTGTAPSSIPHDIAKKTAPLLFGPLVNWALYGVLCVQTYVYSYNFPNDRRFVKCLVYSTFLFETAQTAMNGADVYYWFAEGFGNVERLEDPHLAPIDVPLSLMVVAFVVQLYFCHRIWTLDKRLLILCIVVSVLSIFKSIVSTWGSIKSLTLGRFTISSIYICLWVVPSALADILIAIAMVLLLSRTRIDGARFTNFIMIRVVRLTIETNVLSAGMTIVCFILAVTFPHDTYFVLVGEMLEKIYSNTLLVSLNNRIYFRDHRRGNHVDNDRFMVPDQSHPLPRTSLQFAQVGLPVRTTTMGDNSQLDTIPHAVDLEKSKSDVVSSIDSEPSSSNS